MSHCVSLNVLVAACAIVAPSSALAQKSATGTVDGAASAATIPPQLFKDGKLTQEGFHFTTPAYQREALRHVLREANQAAIQLKLPEKLPIVETDLTGTFIVGYGMSQVPPGMIGNVHTRSYGYFVSVDHKLSFVEGAHQDVQCMKWRDEYKWPASRLDTNAAYHLATQWLVAAEMDMRGLTRDCAVRIVPNAYWNAGMNKGTFCPIYDIFWISDQNRVQGFGNAARVSLFLPTRTLVSLRVQDPKYILREPLVFTNIDTLLSDTNR